ncbi:hypothetical protein CH376_22075 [Leptospira adleri]|uniref:MurNAc-LAA domain-containing protein n=1 Tax=Leptospira adleri TaxID=2023186 RepID=A0ABX4NSD4_9LEPT|nr:hypothetical protein CH376_22075 [Leptospira adleri]
MLEKSPDRLLFTLHFNSTYFGRRKGEKSDLILIITIGKQVAHSTRSWILLKMKTRFFFYD